jgi:DNA replication and repair protein RecF
MEEFKPVFTHNFHSIAGDREDVGIEYTSQLSEAGMEELIGRHRAADLSAGRTTTGPHRDDLQFSIYGRPLKKTGSQGQQKSFLAALKLAQFDLVERKKGQKPLLFLDDIMDKFDPERIAHIVRMISDGRFGQVFLTDTAEERLEATLKKYNLDYFLFRVTDSTITKQMPDGMETQNG